MARKGCPSEYDVDVPLLIPARTGQGFSNIEEIRLLPILLTGGFGLFLYDACLGSNNQAILLS